MARKSYSRKRSKKSHKSRRSKKSGGKKIGGGDIYGGIWALCMEDSFNGKMFKVKLLDGIKYIADISIISATENDIIYINDPGNPSLSIETSPYYNRRSELIEVALKFARKKGVQI